MPARFSQDISNGEEIDACGNIWRWKSGLLHSECGKPSVEFDNGIVMFHTNGKLHRIEGPVIIHADGTCFWFFENQLIPVSSQNEFEQWLRLKAFW